MPSSDTPTILVVEDDDIVRMLMVDVLEELDFQVLEADGWDPALAALQGNNPVDLLVTDVGLCDAADRTGLDLAREALLLCPNIAVLVASGYGNTLELPAGAQLLSKPFTIDSLRDTVNALLVERSTRSL